MDVYSSKFPIGIDCTTMNNINVNIKKIFQTSNLNRCSESNSAFLNAFYFEVIRKS